MNKTLRPYLLAIIASLFLGLSSITQCENLIFDMNGVLAEVSKFNAFLQISPRIILHGSYWSSNKTQNKFFNCLEKVTPRLEDIYVPLDPKTTMPLPQIMCDWLKNTQSNQDILDLTNEAIDTDSSYGLSEKKLLKSMCSFTFNPETFASLQTFINDAVDFAYECKKNGHNLYILSNWDAESFDILCDMHPDFFAIFDGIIISGDVQLAKPDPAIYECLLDTYNLDPQECIFFDDQQANCDSAESCGIYSVQVTKKTKLRQEFKNWLHNKSN
jgi:HAD superfamily hydrolase (TIGR01509 family)